MRFLVESKKLLSTKRLGIMALERNLALKRTYTIMNNTSRNLPRSSFCYCCSHFKVFVCWLFGWFSFVFSSKKKPTENVRTRLRNQCKETFKVPERKTVKGHWEKDASEGKKADLTNTAVIHKSESISRKLRMHLHPQKTLG